LYIEIRSEEPTDHWHKEYIEIAELPEYIRHGAILVSQLPPEVQEHLKMFVDYMSEQEELCKIFSLIDNLREYDPSIYPYEENLPLWRKTEYQDNSRKLNKSAVKFRRDRHTTRANLWSGERKRQCLEKM